jgi:hypothetical protein
LAVEMEMALVAVVPAAPVAVTLTVMVIVSALPIAGAVHTYGAVPTHGTGVPGAELKTKVGGSALVAFVRVPVTATLVSGVASLFTTTVYEYAAPGRTFGAEPTFVMAPGLANAGRAKRVESRVASVNAAMIRVKGTPLDGL